MMTAYDAWVLARVVSAQPVDGEVLAPMTGAWHRVAERLHGESPGARGMLLDGYLMDREDAEAIGRMIDLADPMGPAPAPAPSPGPSAGPGLPPLRVRLTPLSAVQERPIEWLWEDRVPLGMLTLWAGAPKLGKSYVSLDLAAAVSRGIAMPGSPPAEGPGSVVLLSAEDDLARTILPRFRAAGGDRERVFAIESVFLECGGEALPSLKKDMEKIEEAVESLGDCRLVVIDPISAYLSGVDDHRNTELRGVLSPLKAMAERHNVAVVMLSHLNKGGGNGAMARERVQGSVAYVGACRANFLFVRDASDPARRRVLMADLGGNLAGPAPTLGYVIEEHHRQTGPCVCWLDEPLAITADEALEAERARSESRKEAAAPERGEAKQWLREVLSAGPIPTTEVLAAARAAGIGTRTINRAKRELDVKAIKEGFGLDARWLWSLDGTKAG